MLWGMHTGHVQSITHSIAGCTRSHMLCRALLGAVKMLKEEADKRMEEKGEVPPKALRDMSERAR